MATTNRSQKQTADQKMIDGLKKHEATLPSLVLDGTTYKTADVITVLQGLVNSAQAVVESRAAWRASVASDKSAGTDKKALVSALVSALRAAFGGSIDTLADFGLTPHKRAVRTPEQKAAAAAKAKATRAARHTMGKKQKALVKGDVTKAPAPVNAPPAPAPAPAPTPAPAPATPHS